MAITNHERVGEALGRLRNVVGRLESSWRPASAEEGFEIVRRRLFERIIDGRLPKSAWTYREWWSNQSDITNRPQAAA